MGERCNYSRGRQKKTRNMDRGARPDLAASKRALGKLESVIMALERLLGRKAVAYLAHVKDATVIDRWIEGKPTPGDTEFRLRLAFQIASMLHEHEESAVVQAWFFGLNPALQDRIPATMLREGSPSDRRAVLAAAREFVASVRSARSYTPLNSEEAARTIMRLVRSGSS